MSTDAPPDVDAPAPSLPLVSEKGHVYLLGAGLSWCCVTVRAIEREHLVIDLTGVTWRVRLDPEAPPRRVTGHQYPVVTITAKRSYDLRRPRGR